MAHGTPESIASLAVTSLKHPVVALVLAGIGFVGSYTITTTTVKDLKDKTATLELKQEEMKKAELTKEEFYREMGYIQRQLDELSKKQDDESKKFDDLLILRGKR